MNAQEATSSRRIAIVDDDASVRNSTRRLIRSFGYDAEAFASADEFLNSTPARAADCLILDVRMPGISGLELQRRLAESNPGIPIIFITAVAGDEEHWRAIQDGAVAFLRKPVSEQALLSAIRAGLRQSSDEPDLWHDPDTNERR